MIDYKNSVVLIGFMGVGKSCASVPLSKKTGYRHFPIDAFVDMRTEKEIERKLRNPRLKQEERGQLENDLRLKGDFPNIPNFKELGYSPAKEAFIKKVWGDTGVSIYRKQFEMKLMQEACKNIDGPVIFDLGAGFAVCDDEMYQQFMKKHPIFAKFVKHDLATFDTVQQTLGQFDKVVYLQLPENNKDWSGKARDHAHKNDVWEKQFLDVATVTVDTTGLFVDGRRVDDTSEFETRLMQAVNISRGPVVQRIPPEEIDREYDESGLQKTNVPYEPTREEIDKALEYKQEDEEDELEDGASALKKDD